MLKLAAVVILTTEFCLVHSTIIAGAGYFAASPYVRNFLIGTGVADEISRQADVLYDVSGFRYAADQGTSRRKASMSRHDIIEVPSASVDNGNMRPLRRTKREYPLHQERGYFEKLFGLVHTMDRNSCMIRLLCEIGHDFKPYGVIGYRIANYLRSLPPVTWNSDAHPYVEAFSFGRDHGAQDCRSYFDHCRYDLQKVLNFLWTFVFKYPLHFAR